MRYNKLFASLLLMTLASGCASIISSSKQIVTVASDPDDAIIQLDGIQVGKTPATFPMERSGRTKMLTISKDGFESQSVPLKPSVNPVFFGNIISGGLLGSTTDGISGAAHEYRPGYFFVLLKPSNGSEISSSGQIKMYVVQNYANLIKEIKAKTNSKGKLTYGLATQGLFKVLKTPDSEKDTILKQLQIFADSSKTAIDFSIKVATLETK